MEMYTEQGLNRKECELKIYEKYKKPFHILKERNVRLGGFLGLFSRQGVQVEFYFSPAASYKSPVTHGYQNSLPISWQVLDAGEKSRRQYMQTPDLEEEKRKVLAVAGKSYEQIAASGREASQQILDSLKEINEKLDTGGKKEEHPSFVQAEELLRNNDFSDKYINGMLEKLRKELPLEKLDNFDIVQDHLLEWIGESFEIYAENPVPRKPKIMVLIGPTGVGKTTTVAKLAAIFGIGTENMAAIDVRMITIDAFRIGAKEQLESYGNIMQINVSCVDNRQDLRKQIAIHSEATDLFLIDTIGKSPKDAAKLGEMKEILDGAGRAAEFHLVIGATTKSSDIEDIMRQFEPFNYKSILLTKLDETEHVGNVISALAEKKKPVSYITEGQKVPNDIRKATVVRFLINLDGFKINREKIENRFPAGEADQFKWS